MAGDRTVLSVSITGRVQGVSYRAWAQDAARELGVDGWIRNEPDGSVRAAVAGPKEATDALINRMRKGPSAARVADVTTSESDEQVGPGFSIKP